MQPTNPEDPQPAPDGTSGGDVAIAVDHCWQLLASTRVARVAFVEDGRPQLVVMNHLPHGRDLLFQTNEESRLAAMTEGGKSLPVAIEVDSASASGRTGWSVIASGTLARTTEAEVGQVPSPWRPEAVGVLLRMTVDQVSGRHVGSGS
jgi:hypothetical protein